MYKVPKLETNPPPPINRPSKYKPLGAFTCKLPSNSKQPKAKTVE